MSPSTSGHRVEESPEAPGDDEDDEDGEPKDEKKEEKKETTPKGSPSVPKGSSPTSSTRSKTAASATTMPGYFEDELRGYRLLKACALQSSERQQVLTLTRNSTKFATARQALRTMFDDGWPDHQRRSRPTAWWAEHDDAFYNDGWSWGEFYEEAET